MNQETVIYATTSRATFVAAQYNGQRIDGWFYSLGALRYWAKIKGYKHVRKCPSNGATWFY